MPTRLSFLALVLAAGPVAAQGLTSPYPPRPPRPGSFDPTGPRPSFTPNVPSTGLPPFGGATGGYVFARPLLYNPIVAPPGGHFPSVWPPYWYFYAPMAPSTFLGLDPLIDPEAVGRPADDRISSRRPAAPPAGAGGVTVDLPAVAELWVNGVKQPGRQGSWDVSVPTAGGTTTVALKAEWTTGGTKYEWTRDMTVSPGDHGRLTVVSGTAVSAPPAAPAPRAK